MNKEFVDKERVFQKEEYIRKLEEPRLLAEREKKLKERNEKIMKIVHERLQKFGITDRNRREQKRMREFASESDMLFKIDNRND